MKKTLELMVKSGAVRGPFRERLLPALGKALREEQWPLPLAVRTLKLRELAVLERRVLDDRNIGGGSVRAMCAFASLLPFLRLFIEGLRELVHEWTTMN